MIENKTAIIIPIRMKSSRLPGKFHKDIYGAPMVIRVLRQAKLTNIKNIYVAVDDQNHYDLIKDYGGIPIMTNVNHKTGTDRCYEVIEKIDNKNLKYIVNLQGDLPFISPKAIISCLKILDKERNVDIATLAARIDDHEEINNPNVVKIALTEQFRALYFSRAPIPYNAKYYYHHLGLYAFKKESFIRFVKLPQSNLEKSENLEQLRALENGMNIYVNELDEFPISVDTKEDLNKAIKFAMQLENKVI